jgi:hypothetical protein
MVRTRFISTRRSIALRSISVSALILLLLTPSVSAKTLREAYQLAGPANGYDKYVELETGVVYTGGLLIGPIFDRLTNELTGEPGQDVCLVGNGAILDLQGSQLCISYCNNRLDVEDCIVLGGNIRFRGINNSTFTTQPVGSVRYVTFYAPHDYGIRLQGTGTGVLLERNIILDAVDTGYDYLYITGYSGEWLPTGTNISFSIQAGQYGVPDIRHNWTYHYDEDTNLDLLAHFSLLCEYS